MSGRKMDKYEIDGYEVIERTVRPASMRLSKSCKQKLSRSVQAEAEQE